MIMDGSGVRQRHAGTVKTTKNHRSFFGAKLAYTNDMALLRRNKNLEHFLILATEAMKREKLKKNTLTCTRKKQT